MTRLTSLLVILLGAGCAKTPQAPPSATVPAAEWLDHRHGPWDYYLLEHAAPPQMKWWQFRIPDEVKPCRSVGGTPTGYLCIDGVLVQVEPLVKPTP